MAAADILDFAPAEGFVEITNPGRLHTGEPAFFLEYFPSRADGGGRAIVWDGTSHEAALEAAEGFTRDGIRCIDRAGGVFPSSGEIQPPA